MKKSPITIATKVHWENDCTRPRSHCNTCTLETCWLNQCTDIKDPSEVDISKYYHDEWAYDNGTMKLRKGKKPILVSILWTLLLPVWYPLLLVCKFFMIWTAQDDVEDIGGVIWWKARHTMGWQREEDIVKGKDFSIGFGIFVILFSSITFTSIFWLILKYGK